MKIEIKKNRRNTSVQFFTGNADFFFKTVNWYMQGPVIKDLRRKIYWLSLYFRDEDLCRVDESKMFLEFKRDILAIVAKYMRRYCRIEEKNETGFCLVDDMACSCVTAIERYVDDWWNCGATCEYLVS